MFHLWVFPLVAVPRRNSASHEWWSVNYRHIRITLPRNGCAPTDRNSRNTVQCFFKRMASANQRKPQIVFSGGAECRTRNPGNTTFFEQYSGNLFRWQAGVFHIDPGVERSVRNLASKSRDAIKPRYKKIATLAVFRDHGVHRVGRIAPSFNSRDLRELGDARERIEHQQIHSVHHVWGRHGVSQTPAGHRKTL